MGSVDLILFSRAPVAGKSKTRLAAALGAEAARDFHVCCLKDLIAACGRFKRLAAKGGAGRVRCHLFVTPPDSGELFAAVGVTWPRHFRVHPQRGRGLGKRMANAMSSVMDGSSVMQSSVMNGCCVKDGPQGAARTLLVGSDLPLLDERQLVEALAALDDSDGLTGADVVFGPTEDGGYYLVGMKRPHPELFALEGWGGSSVLEASLARAAGLGLSARLISPLPDVDEVGDLERVRAHPLFSELSRRRAVRFIAALPAEAPPRG